MTMNIKMNLDDQKIKEILIRKNESFKNLAIKHREFEHQLEELNNRSFKTDRELIEERNLKKQKLRLKDSMQKYIFEYRQTKKGEIA